MTISDKVFQSPGWWLSQAILKRADRVKRLAELALWHEGNPPAPMAVEGARESFREFEEEARTNYAELIVGSLRERMAVRDVKTAASGDDSDAAAWKYWTANGMDVEISTIIETMLWAGDSFCIVGEDTDTNEVTATAEDPRDVVTFHDPARQSKVTAAVKFLHDPFTGRDQMVLWLPGSVRDKTKALQFVAYSKADADGSTDLQDWEWSKEDGGQDGLPLKHHLVPVVRFRNRAGIGEFENHLSILRRLNRFTFQLTVIVLYQAFKQRAVILTEDEDDVEVQNEFKEKVGLADLDDALTSDPGSWFLLPSGAKIWESSQTDMQGILSAIKDDVNRLAAVTRRPMAIFAPDNQSGTGAQFTREGLTFAVEDKITRVSQGIVDVFHLIFLTAGDQERADKGSISVGWKPTERVSLGDPADATSKVKDVFPVRTILRVIWNMTPTEIDQVIAEMAENQLLFGDLAGDEATDTEAA